MLTLIRALLGTFRQLGLGLVCGRQTFEVILDFLVDIIDHLLVIAIPSKRLLEGKQMLWTIIALQRLRDLFLAALHTAVAQLGQPNRVAIPFQDRIQNALTTDAGNIAQHVMDLEIHLVQSLLHVPYVLGAHLDEVFSMAPMRADGADRGRWAETRSQ